jgi:hypothetical protein
MRLGSFALFLTGAMTIASGIAGAQMIRADGTMTNPQKLAPLAHRMEATKTCTGTIAMRTHAASHEAQAAHAPACFKVRIANITQADQFTASDGTKFSLAFSPGTFVVTSAPQPDFTLGAADLGYGLRAQAEDGNPAPLAAHLMAAYPGSGAFLVPVGGAAPAPIRPGDAYEFYVAARPGEKLYLTTMMGQSNDWFYAPANGIALFNAAGKPAGGDVSAAMKLYDAGTEADEEIGIGPSQGPRQPHPRFGPDDTNPLVRLVTTDTRFVDPAKHLRVTITPQ